MYNHDQFDALLVKLGCRLQSECINRVGSLYGKVKHHERLPWLSPPLITSHKLLGLPLQDLVDQLYAIPLDLDAFSWLWDRAATVLQEATPATRAVKLVHHFRDVIHFPFTLPDSRDPFVPLVQALAVVCAGRPYKLTVGLQGAHVTTPNGLFEVTPRRLTGPLGTHRLRLPSSSKSWRTALTMPLGKGLPSSPLTTGAFRIAARTVPELHEEIRTLFSIAVAAGKQYEKTLASMFDVQILDDDTRDMWTEARQLVDFSEGNPTPELYKLLSVVFDHKELVGLLGYPRHAPKGYTTAARCAHRKLIDDLESRVVVKKKGKVHDLLAIQSKLRG